MRIISYVGFFFIYIARRDKKEMSKFSVYVDGIEVNDYYLTKDEAKRLKEEYELDGYDCVEIVRKSEMKEEK